MVHVFYFLNVKWLGKYCTFYAIKWKHFKTQKITLGHKWLRRTFRLFYIIDIQYTFTLTVEKNSFPIKWIEMTITSSASFLCMHLWSFAFANQAQPFLTELYASHWKRLCTNDVKFLSSTVSAMQRDSFQPRPNYTFDHWVKCTENLSIEHQKFSSCRTTGKKSKFSIL